jgi:hypothetical protein
MAIRPGLGFDGGELCEWSPMLRWLLVGAMVAGLGVGLQNGWIVIQWTKMATDLKVPFLAEPEPIKVLSR